MDEELRAAAYRIQATKRAAFRVLLKNRLVAPVIPAALVNAAWAPFKERSRHDEYSEPEEKRTGGIVNG